MGVVAINGKSVDGLSAEELDKLLEDRPVTFTLKSEVVKKKSAAELAKESELEKLKRELKDVEAEVCDLEQQISANDQKMLKAAGGDDGQTLSGSDANGANAIDNLIKVYKSRIGKKKKRVE